MTTFAPAKRADMERRAAEVTVARRAASTGAPKTPRSKNVAAILTLSNATFFAFRGRPFGVPPLPWREGERLLELQTRAQDAAAAVVQGATHGKAYADARRDYFAAMDGLARHLWKLSRPVGRIPRAMRALGIHRNPFLAATEGELREITSFFLTRRTRSSVSFRPATPLPDRAMS